MDKQLVELAVSTSSATPYDDFLEAQDLLESQIELLENIVTTQCDLTGINPLSQEMATGALSIKIGKRPRDLLNPKAVKYMQSVFSIKDTPSKRETREISTLFSVTATQVREYFNNQRSRVRKYVRLSKEKENRFTTCNEMHDGVPTTLDPNMPLEPVPIHSVVPMNTEEVPSCSAQDEVPSHVEDLDRHFLENIFSLMRKEELFSGQVKLMEWIMQIQNPSILHWFLTKGGVMILATWLSQAASDEQASVLNTILKVLCHLPLQKALPGHMSAILQSVNKLRFYRISDIANKARMLLFRWSKVFAKSQALKKRNGMNSAGDSQDEMLLKQSIDEVMGDEAWDSKHGNFDNAIVSCENQGNLRKLEFSQPLKMLTASADDSNKRLGVLSSQALKRRKVQMVEHPVQRTGVRSIQVAKSSPATQSRPLSADDIQKAKMRAQFMQNKYGKNAISSNDSSEVKLESEKNYTSLQASLPVPKANVLPKLDEQRILDKDSSKVATRKEPLREATVNLDSGPPWKKYKIIQIPWQTPPEVKISDAWSVGVGENSKEVEVQKNRTRREREIIYRTIQEILSDPREPWDREMDYDDLLTPEVPIEQLPDVEPLEQPVPAVENIELRQVTAPLASTSSSHNVAGSSSSSSLPEPDIELLAELLKNPELVIALTSGNAGDISSRDTLKLLDMIKANGMNSLSSLGALGRNVDNIVEVSLPSPTPSSDLVLGGSKPDFSRNPFSRQHTVANGNVSMAPGSSLSILREKTFPANSLVQPQIPATLLAPQSSAAVQQLVQRLQPSVSSLQTASQQWQSPVVSPLHHTPVNTKLASETMLNTNNFANSNLAILNGGSPYSPASPVPMSNVQPERHIERLLPTTVPPHQLKQAQLSYIPEPTVSNTWRGKQGFESAPHYRDRYDLGETSGFESWSPDNSPMRLYENTGGRNNPGPIRNPRNGYRQERTMLQNPAQPSSYRNHGRGGNTWWRGGRR